MGVPPSRGWATGCTATTRRHWATSSCRCRCRASARKPSPGQARGTSALPPHARSPTRAKFLEHLMSRTEILRVTEANGAVPGTGVAMVYSQDLCTRGRVAPLRRSVARRASAGAACVATLSVISRFFAQAVSDVTKGANPQRALDEAAAKYLRAGEHQRIEQVIGRYPPQRRSSHIDHQEVRPLSRCQARQWQARRCRAALQRTLKKHCPARPEGRRCRRPGWLRWWGTARWTRAACANSPAPAACTAWHAPGSSGRPRAPRSAAIRPGCGRARQCSPPLHAAVRRCECESAWPALPRLPVHAGPPRRRHAASAAPHRP